MIGPVHWGSVDATTLERVAAVLFAQDAPSLMRRTPASGDGGIDLLIQHEDGYEVVQVKGFTGRLTTGRRRQIEQSVAEAERDPRLDGEILHYRCAVPIDLTPSEQRWFEKLRDSAPWPMSWWGLPQWDDSAARHTHVIDYMLGGGRERVRERAVAIQLPPVDPGQPLDAASAVSVVERLQQQLNREDPHFFYEIGTSASEPPASDAEGAAMMSTRKLADGSWLRVRVIPRHRYALEDEPITGRLTIRPDNSPQGQELRAKFEEFTMFGRDLTIPDGMLSFEIEAPGGLGGSAESAGGWFGTNEGSGLGHLRIVRVDENSTVVAELLLEIVKSNRGSVAAEIHLRDESGLVDATLVIPAPGTAAPEDVSRFNFTLHTPAGRPVGEVLPCLRVFANRDGEHRLQVRPPYGKGVIGEANPVPSDQFPSQSVLTHVEDLVVLQTYASNVIQTPDVIDPTFAAELHSFVRMLNGEVLNGTWGDFRLALNTPRGDLPVDFRSEGALAMTADMFVEYQGESIDLGPFTTVLDNPRLADEQPDDPFELRLVPSGANTFRQWAGPVHAQQTD